MNPVRRLREVFLMPGANLELTASAMTSSIGRARRLQRASRRVAGRIPQSDAGRAALADDSSTRPFAITGRT